VSDLNNNAPNNNEERLTASVAGPKDFPSPSSSKSPLGRLGRIASALIDLALEEDLGPGDITGRLATPEEARGVARVMARARLTVSGLSVFREVFWRVDPFVEVKFLAKDGDALSPGDPIAEIEGPARSLLAGERVALNFLARLSGVATMTREFVLAMGPAAWRVKLLDTRKTTPGQRALEKAAVVHGGGFNHRFGLFDGILIKDNHIAAAGSIEAAMSRTRKDAPHGLKIEVEVDDSRQIEEALRAGADLLLLDNMDPARLTAAVQLVEKFFAPSPRRVLLEASGGVNLNTIGAIASSGVDFVSVGALTHSAPSVDLGLDWL
jgi:nicotinate-nucleotide pyrophosphorylase (carboxylating)